MVNNISKTLRKMNFVISSAPYKLPPVALCYFNGSRQAAILSVIKYVAYCRKGFQPA